MNPALHFHTPFTGYVRNSLSSRSHHPVCGIRTRSKASTSTASGPVTDAPSTAVIQYYATWRAHEIAPLSSDSELSRVRLEANAERGSLMNVG